jgi:predicted RNA-binding Zn-ribbon protein involved in translation (DUF1610 family)
VGYCEKCGFDSVVKQRYSEMLCPDCGNKMVNSYCYVCKLRIEKGYCGGNESSIVNSIRKNRSIERIEKNKVVDKVRVSNRFFKRDYDAYSFNQDLEFEDKQKNWRDFESG